MYLGPTSSMDSRMSPRYRPFRKATDIPSPASTFAFQDLTPQNLCTPAFIVLMPGEANDEFFHLPATHHNRGGVVSFADGHSEIRRWKDARTMTPIKKGVTFYRGITRQPNNRDIIWMQEHATRRLERGR
jgi:prepilin-type processing-associated H-X9-DG protein